MSRDRKHVAGRRVAMQRFVVGVQACLVSAVAMAAEPPLRVGMELSYPPFEMTDRQGPSTINGIPTRRWPCSPPAARRHGPWASGPATTISAAP